MRFILASLLIVCLPSLARSQAFGIGTSFGYYRPFADFAPANLLSSDLPTTPSELSAPTWGVDAYVAVRPRWRLEAFLSTAYSELPLFVSPADASAWRTKERVTLAALDAQYIISTRSNKSHLLLSAGPALIRHGGEGYSRYGSPRSWGGAVGIDFERPLAQHLQLTAGARAFVYSINLDTPPEHGRQFDGLFSLGLRTHR